MSDKEFQEHRYDRRKLFINNIEHSFRKLNQRHRKVSSVKWIVYPDDPLKLTWDFVIFVLTFYSITVIPYKIAFWEDDTDTTESVDLIINYFFFLDVLVNFLTAYESSDFKIETDYRLIAVNYLKTWFVPDLLSCLPFELIFTSMTTKLLKMIRVIKLARILKLLKSKQLSLINKLSLVAFGEEKLIIGLCSVTVICHLFACLWYGFARMGENSWVDVDPVQEGAYLASLYFVVTTVTTVGFGDILPTNDKERVICLVIILFGVFLYSYIIGSITAIMTKSIKRNEIVNKKLDSLYSLSKELKMSNGLLKRLVHTIRNHNRYVNSYTELLEALPKKISEKLYCLIYKDVIMSNEFFNNMNIGFIYKIARELIPYIVKEYEFVYKIGRGCDASKI